MKRLKEILGYYATIDEFLERERLVSVKDGDWLKKIEDRQRINDHAYFILGWGQLEATLDAECRNAIRKRRDNPDWSKRRGWDLYQPDAKKLSGLTFEDRVTLLLDRKSKSGEWQKVMRWYNLRNLIAHGGSHEDRIDLNAVVRDFYLIQTAIAP